MDNGNRTEYRDPRGTRDPRPRMMRVGDADREAMADILRQHYAAGRLDSQEFEERIGRCLAAKTFGDFDGLFDDLPPLTPPAPEPGQGPWQGHGPWQGPQHPYPQHPTHGYGPPPWRPVYIIPIILGIIVLGALTHGHLFWLFWPLFFLFIFGPWRRRGWR